MTDPVQPSQIDVAHSAPAETLPEPAGGFEVFETDLELAVSTADLASKRERALIYATPKAEVESAEEIPFNKPRLFGLELANIADAVRSGQISGTGKYGKLCEQRLRDSLGGSSEVLLVPSCTAGLEMAAMLLSRSADDEVILPSFTFVSTATAFIRAGMKPVFADLDPGFPNVSSSHIESLLSGKTRAVCLVHYAGVGCEMESLLGRCSSQGVEVVEDAAHALGGSYRGKPLGTFGSLATFSFHETKNVTCGEGGALIINSPKFVEDAHIIRDKGTNRRAFQRGDAPFYTLVGPGSSYVISDVLAAFLLAQLENLDEITRRRLQAIRYYQTLLKPIRDAGLISYPDELTGPGSAGHMFYCLLENESAREKLRIFLKDRGIMAVFHYQPLHRSPYIESRWGKQPRLPVTESVSARLLRFPLFNAISAGEIRRVAREVGNFFGVTAAGE